MDTKKIFVIDDVGDLFEFISDIFKDYIYMEIIHSKSNTDDLIRNFKTDLNLVLVNQDSIENDLAETIDFVNKYHFFITVPCVILSSDKNVVSNADIMHYPIVAYYLKPVNAIRIKTNILTLLRIFEYNQNVNDISGLPGAEIISRKLIYELVNKSEFSYLFLDLDNFKDYNDYYGFKRGNDVLRFFSHLLQDVISEIGTLDDFIGNIGGDDFVIILKDYRGTEKLCEEIINRFNEGIKNFYNEEDLERKYIEVIDRKGNLSRFPVMGISISVIKYDEFNGRDFDDVYKELMKIKKEVKKINGSAFLIK